MTQTPLQAATVEELIMELDRRAITMTLAVIPHTERSLDHRDLMVRHKGDPIAILGLEQVLATLVRAHVREKIGIPL